MNTAPRLSKPPRRAVWQLQCGARRRRSLRDVPAEERASLLEECARRQAPAPAEDEDADDDELSIPEQPDEWVVLLPEDGDVVRVE